jgi:xanthine dehydrogenase accessory factor
MEDLPLYEEIIRLKTARIPAALATVVETKGSTPRKAGAKMLVRHDGSIVGTIGGGQTEVETIAAALEVIRLGQPRTSNFSLTEPHGSYCGGEVRIYLEPLVVPQQLVVVGGGHVGRAVGQAAELAGFKTTLIHTGALEVQAVQARYHSVQELPDAFADLGVDSSSYIFIATTDHPQDFQATAAALNTEARYISLLGSRRKRLALEKYLAGRDFTPEVVARVFSPAGLEIGAETPAEIAISVVAQMIKVRRSGYGEDRRNRPGGGPLAADGAQ